MVTIGSAFGSGLPTSDREAGSRGVAASILSFLAVPHPTSQVADDYMAARGWLGRWSSFRAVALHETVDVTTDVASRAPLARSARNSGNCRC